MKFSQWLKNAREHAGISQADLATRVGSTHQYISGLEAGRTRISIKQSIQLARLLGLEEKAAIDACVEQQVTRAMRELKYEIRMPINM